MAEARQQILLTTISLTSALVECPPWFFPHWTLFSVVQFQLSISISSLCHRSSDSPSMPSIFRNISDTAYLLLRDEAKHSRSDSVSRTAPAASDSRPACLKHDGSLSRRHCVSGYCWITLFSKFAIHFSKSDAILPPAAATPAGGRCPFLPTGNAASARTLPSSILDFPRSP